MRSAAYTTEQSPGSKLRKERKEEKTKTKSKSGCLFYTIGSVKFSLKTLFMCIYDCACGCGVGAHRGQKRATGSLELEFKGS